MNKDLKWQVETRPIRKSGSNEAAGLSTTEYASKSHAKTVAKAISKRCSSVFARAVPSRIIRSGTIKPELDVYDTMLLKLAEYDEQTISGIASGYCNRQFSYQLFDLDTQTSDDVESCNIRYWIGKGQFMRQLARAYMHGTSVFQLDRQFLIRTTFLRERKQILITDENFDEQFEKICDQNGWPYGISAEFTDKLPEGFLKQWDTTGQEEWCRCAILPNQSAGCTSAIEVYSMAYEFANGFMILQERHSMCG